MKTITISKTAVQAEILDTQDVPVISDWVLCVDTTGIPCAYPGHAEPSDEARLMQMIEVGEGEDLLDDILQWDLIADELTPQLSRLTGTPVTVKFS
ncbi:MAG: hypothetical protein OIF57_06765 [Marinobacterium sp.]|nr:hypothetical protein [Marinobacterium sp.]